MYVCEKVQEVGAFGGFNDLFTPELQAQTFEYENFMDYVKNMLLAITTHQTCHNTTGVLLGNRQYLEVLM